MLKVGFYTLGCKVSQYETEAIAEEFERRGYLRAPFSEVCDAYVINTCTVTEESDRKSRQMIRRAIRKNPKAVVAVVGCYSQRAPADIEKIDGVSVVIGTQDKMTAVDRVIERLENNSLGTHIADMALEGCSFEPMTVGHAPRTRAYVKIEDGCESKCSYCAIRIARGPVRSKPMAEVIKEVETLYKGGTREIVLTGIETGSYGKDIGEGYGLAELIIELDRRHSCDRIRLGSLAPELLPPSFSEKLKGVKILAPHFHISMQSGSDKVLAAMKRRYNVDMVLRNISALRDAFPTAMFTTDLMVGFPGESEEDFLDTISLVDKIGLLDAHVFQYSRREGTEAAYYPDQVDERVKQERSERLIAYKNKKRDEILDEIVREGRELSAILEVWSGGVYSAHSDSFIELSVEAPKGLSGEIVSVVPVSHNDGIIKAKIAKI